MSETTHSDQEPVDPHAPAGPRTFHWRAARAVVGDLAARHLLVVEHGGRWLEAVDGSLRVHPPLVAPLPEDCGGVHHWLGTVPERLGAHLVLLMQAGAVSLGWFEDETAVETKSFRRYVVRGSGRAQPTHLRTKGKSRYGSRLRLQNAQALLEETNERTTAWWRARGPAERVLVGAPVRLFASLFDVEPVPPFPRDFPVQRIGRDLPRPTTDVLLRAYRSCCYGRVERLVP